MLRRLRLLLCAAVALAPLGWMTFGPAFYNGQLETVFYEDRSGWDREVTLAVAQWNAADVGVRFEPAAPGQTAHLTIVSDPKRIESDECHDRRPQCVAFAVGGRIKPGGHSTVVLGVRDGPDDGAAADDVRLVTHELGHVLGLEHGNDCGVMNPQPISLERCISEPFVHARRGLCGPMPDDIERAAKLWGGPGAPASDRYCTAAGLVDIYRDSHRLQAAIEHEEEQAAASAASDIPDSGVPHRTYAPRGQMRLP